MAKKKTNIDILLEEMADKVIDAGDKGRWASRKWKKAQQLYEIACDSGDEDSCVDLIGLLIEALQDANKNIDRLQGK